MSTANAIASPHEEVPLPLSALLRTSTADRHERAETRTFISDLMGGELSLEVYTSFMAQLAYIYEALESRDISSDPAPLDDPRLARLGALESDLAALGVADWRESHPILPSTAAYAQRLREVARGGVPEYVAHHYTRYLGDLSGGQIIGTMIARHYGATPDQLAFYRFEGIEKPVPYKRAYRDALDALEFDDAQRDAAVEEARAAFDYNAALFDELGSRAVVA